MVKFDEMGQKLCHTNLRNKMVLNLNMKKEKDVFSLTWHSITYLSIFQTVNTIFKKTKENVCNDLTGCMARQG